MTRTFWIGAATMAIAMSTAVGAQSAMSNSMASDKMAGMDKSYTGCVEKDAKTGAYSLSHAMTADMMAKGDGMTKDSAPMGMKKSAMADNMWMPVMSTNVDLSKHVGHKVTVTGSGAAPMAMGKGTMAMKMDAFTVKSLTMVSSSCAGSK